MRTLYDSITAADIPADAPMVAGYVDGTYRWSAADWQRFPNATKVRIAVKATTTDGHVLDVEPGDATPAQAVGWVRMRRAAGVDPAIYCNLTALPQVQAAFASAGEPQPHYWVARYDGVPSIPPGCVAKQYIDDPASGGHFDLSAVADFWPGVDPAPFAPIAKGLDSMSVIPAPLDYRADFDNVALPFETGSSSSVVKQGWLSLLATFGDSDYEVICLKGGQVVPFASQSAPTVGVLKENTRVFFEFPDGAEGLAIRYRNQTAGARLGYAFPQIPK